MLIPISCCVDQFEWKLSISARQVTIEPASPISHGRTRRRRLVMRQLSDHLRENLRRLFVFATLDETYQAFAWLESFE